MLMLKDINIKSVTVNDDRSVTLVTESGNYLAMSSALAGVLREQLMKHDVRDAIRYTSEDYDGDVIALGSLDMTEEEFYDEVFSRFEEEIEYGNYPTEDDIQDAVLDTAEDYGIRIDE